VPDPAVLLVSATYLIPWGGSTRLDRQDHLARPGGASHKKDDYVGRFLRPHDQPLYISLQFRAATWLVHIG
jgi:hypothetical protein